MRGNVIYISVVKCAFGICLICMLSALGPAALGLWAYISGKSRMPMLQLIHECVVVTHTALGRRKQFESAEAISR